METQFDRTALLIGLDKVNLLKTKKVLIFGVGGVGSYAVEMFARAGVGTIDVVDCDTVNITNINRQIIALHSTIGRLKVDVVKERVLDINPNVNIQAINKFVTKENIEEFNLASYDFVVDAIDNVTAKTSLPFGVVQIDSTEHKLGYVFVK